MVAEEAVPPETQEHEQLSARARKQFIKAVLLIFGGDAVHQAGAWTLMADVGTACVCAGAAMTLCGAWLVHRLLVGDSVAGEADARRPTQGNEEPAGAGATAGLEPTTSADALASSGDRAAFWASALIWAGLVAVPSVAIVTECPSSDSASSWAERKLQSDGACFEAACWVAVLRSAVWTAFLFLAPYFPISFVTTRPQKLCTDGPMATPTTALATLTTRATAGFAQRIGSLDCSITSQPRR